MYCVRWLTNLPGGKTVPKLRVIQYEAWGNEEDGFEVNNLFLEDKKSGRPLGRIEVIE